MSYHQISQEVRDLFRSDLPEFNPNLIDEELATMYTARPQTGADGSTPAAAP